MMDLPTSPSRTASGRNVVPRRLPPVPSVPPLRRVRSDASIIASSPEASVFSLSPSSSGSSSPATSSSSPATSSSSSPATSLGSLSPQQSPASSLAALERGSRPLPRIPDLSSHEPSYFPSGPAVRLVVCRGCLNCVTTSEGLLAPSAVPPGSRAFRGFSGKASLFTDVYNVNYSPARVQLMVTGAHTMQEITCAKCSAYLGWKIVKAHERTEKWKEGKWLLELADLWLASYSDIFDYKFEEAVESSHEREEQKKMRREPRIRTTSTSQAAAKVYPKDAAKMMGVAREKGLGLEFAEPVNWCSQSGHDYYSQGASNFARGCTSAIHLPMTFTT